MDFDISVFSSYQAQVTLLTSLLRPVYGPSLEIGTVDGMQGREKEAIVISMVRSNDTVCFVICLAVLFYTYEGLLEGSRFLERKAKNERCVSPQSCKVFVES